VGSEPSNGDRTDDPAPIGSGAPTRTGGRDCPEVIGSVVWQQPPGAVDLGPQVRPL